MSDEGEAGQWRPASSHTGQYATPDEATGPLPAVADDDSTAAGFPPVSDSGPASAVEDDAPTGGFPAVPPPAESQPAASGERAPFEPLDRLAVATSVDDSDDEAPSSSVGFSFDADDWPTPSAETPSSNGSGLTTTGSAETGTYGGTTSFYGEKSSYGEDDSNGETGTYGGTTSFYGEKSSYGEDDSNGETGTYGGTSFGRTSALGRTGSFEESAAGPFASRWSYGTDQAGHGTTDEEQSAENEFFGSDDHPGMWEKVAAPAGPPPQPGKPSSGNLRLPDWMREQNQGGGPAPSADDDGFEKDGGSRVPLIAGLTVLVAGLLVAAGVFLFKGGGDDPAPVAQTTVPTTPNQASKAKKQPRQKMLAQFKGAHTKAAGRVTDQQAGLSYPRLRAPWDMPVKKSPMSEIGFSASQFAVTEKAGARPTHWARLMSAELGGAQKDAYQGPGTERAAAVQVADVYMARMFGFRHKTKLLASQPLRIDGRRGWLVGYYVTYHRPGVTATGDLVTVALVDTGRKLPGVLFMTVPNTDRKLWPDVNFVLGSLKVT